MLTIGSFAFIGVYQWVNISLEILAVVFLGVLTLLAAIFMSFYVSVIISMSFGPIETKLSDIFLKFGAGSDAHME